MYSTVMGGVSILFRDSLFFCDGYLFHWWGRSFISVHFIWGSLIVEGVGHFLGYSLLLGCAFLSCCVVVATLQQGEQRSRDHAVTVISSLNGKLFKDCTYGCEGLSELDIKYSHSGSS